HAGLSLVLLGAERAPLPGPVFLRARAGCRAGNDRRAGGHRTARLCPGARCAWAGAALRQAEAHRIPPSRGQAENVSQALIQHWYDTSGYTSGYTPVDRCRPRRPEKANSPASVNVGGQQCTAATFTSVGHGQCQPLLRGLLTPPVRRASWADAAAARHLLAALRAIGSTSQTSAGPAGRAA